MSSCLDLDLHIEGKSSVRVDTLENSSVNIKLDDGHCFLKEIKVSHSSIFDADVMSL